MKIKFIPLLFVLGFIGAKAQITAAKGANVFISPNTLVYSTGDLTVLEDATKTTKVTNNGNILIQDGTYKGGTTDGLFVMPFTSDASYGQMIVKSGTPASGRMSIERKIIDNPASSNAYFGSPFTGYTFDQFAKDVTNDLPGFTAPATPCQPGVYCGSWNKVPIFKWRNTTKPQFDPMNSGTFDPGDFYIIRKNLYNTANVANNLTFRGTPNVPSKATTSIPYPNRVTEGQIKISKNNRNIYKIYYYTYLADPFATGVIFDATTTEATLDAEHYADRTLQLMNPYTANIDLSVLTNGFANITGIASMTGISKNAASKSRYEGVVQTSTIAGGNIVGGDFVRFIPPMTNFIIKASTDGVQLNKLYDPSILTFASNFDRSNNNNPSQKIAAKSANSTASVVNQIALELKSAGKDIFYGRTYLASGSIFKTGDTFKNAEAANLNISSSTTGIYTLPEAETGGVASGFEDTKLYINTMNSGSTKVAVPVGISINPEDGTTYTITSTLTENQIALTKDRNNFSDASAKFYFHDKDLNVVKEITTNFSYTFTQKESTNNRFEIFWKETGNLGAEIDNVQSLRDLTTVYKTGEEYKVRFDKNWKEADVTVFNVMGQLISSEKVPDASNDYVLPIKNSSSTMYIIKITNEKGETVTKKIVK